MADFSTFDGVRTARETLYAKLDTQTPGPIVDYVADQTRLLKDAEEILVLRHQLGA